MDFNDYPTQRNLPWKPIVLGALGVVVLGVVVILLVRWGQANRQEDVFIQEMGAQELRQLERTCASKEDPDLCTSAQLQALAAQYQSEGVCTMLTTEQEQSSCFWRLARTTGEIGFCTGIHDEESRQTCEDDQRLQAVTPTSDPEVCTQIVDEAKRLGCEEQVNPVTAQNCTEQLGEERCQDLALMREATDQENLELCAEIIDFNIRIECQELIRERQEANEPEQTQTEEDQDQDQDGLTDAQEAEYGSDPLNPDTDGDGYADGDEVAAGYSPTGPGTLEEQTNE